MGQTVEVPREVLRKFARASEAFDELHALEDFLITRSRKLLRELRQARREHLAGKTRPWEEFKRDFAASRKRAR